MIIYKISKTVEDGIGLFLSTKQKTTTYWTLEPPEDAEHVKSESECKYINRVYAIEFDTEKLSIEDLMWLLTKKLNTSQVKTICEKDKWISDRLSEYLSGNTSREMQKKLEEQKSHAANAEAMATMAYINSVFD